MSKLNRSEFKELLTEWSLLLNESAVIPLKQVKSQIIKKRRLNSKEQEALFATLEKNWNKTYKKFSNVIFNEINSTGEPVEHMLTAISAFSIYYNTVPEEIKQKIAAGTITSSELRGFVESKKEAKKSETRTSNRVKCRSKANLSAGTRWSESNKSSSRDFEVIYTGSDWTVIYPKSLLGSISWAVGLADGSEESYEVDENGTQIGRVTWCTASYENNRFPMYASNLHMYYFVKNQNYNINDIHRRLCLSVVKHEENSHEVLYGGKDVVEFQFKGGATVNADNLSGGVSSTEEIQATVNNQEIIDLIKAHASTKKSTSIEEMASKITLPMLKQDEEMLANDPDSLNSQIGVYLKYTNNEEIINYIVENYKEKLVHNETIYDDAPLALLIFEREDIEERAARSNLIDRLIELYKNSDYISHLFMIIIHSSIELDTGILNKEIKDKMLDYQSNNINSLKYYYINELISTNNMHKLLDLSDIVKILSSVKKGLETSPAYLHLLLEDTLDVVLQEFNILNFKDFPEYNQVIKLIKDIYVKVNDRLKRKILSNHNYIFESNALERYIRLVLS